MYIILFRKPNVKCNALRVVYTILMTWLSIYFWLKATIWRGPEYRWYGNLFYVPCPYEAPVINGIDTQYVLISMCTGDYEYTLIGKWNGRLINIESGVIQIPDKLKPFVKLPVKSVYIQAYDLHYYDIHNNNIQNPEFIIDTLKKGKIYTLEGKLWGVKDHTPIIRATIRKHK